MDTRKNRKELQRPAFVAILFLASAVFLPAQEPEPLAPSDKADAEVFRRIDRLRRAGTRLRTDGADRDWAEFPQFSDPRGDVEGDGSRDIVGAAIAATESDLWMMVRTAASPSTEAWPYCFRVEMWGDRGANFRIEVEGSQRLAVLRRIDAGEKVGARLPLPQARAAIRHVVEVRIPYRDLLAALPEEAAPYVNGGQALPWIRVNVETWDRRGNTADWGPSVAGYRLMKTPFALDPPLPKHSRAPVEISLPVSGQWFVLQGAFGTFSHRGLWAYDLTVLNAAGLPSLPVRSKNNAHYFAWSQPVLSPIDGRVMRVRSDVEDSRPFGAVETGIKANEVFVQSRQGFGVNLVHLRKGSPDVRMLDLVKPGQVVGRVGSSGASDSPHLHLAAWLGHESLPLAFRNVRVGLNPVADDPWARGLPLWEPRHGHFVQALPERPEGGKLQ